MNKINWKLIFQLSIFGLIMAIVTIGWIPQNMEPYFWLVVFIATAYLVARKAPGNYFLHGFLIAIANCVWITIAHVMFASTYLPNHSQYVEMIASMPPMMKNHERITMAVLGLPFGIGFGLVLGLFCFIASKMVKK